MKVKTMIQILKILTNTSIITAKELSKQFGVSERQIYRYINELTCAGIPINTTRGRYHSGISLDKQYKLRNYNYVI